MAEFVGEVLEAGCGYPGVVADGGVEMEAAVWGDGTECAACLGGVCWRLLSFLGSVLGHGRFT